ncbi:hypothetical protein MLD38_025418 [Melastoma candidum]|uniref:Uncharacterized protein n=1 Tax=Melastoma candidum TaxID=119954 RepID=A0ACB9NYU0_9MYRT|nr:hypothetical protein MLD38_025418 [Melastoma candidum]
MPDRHNNHHHHHHRPNRISVPHRSSAAASASASYFFPTPTPTPSKARPFSSLTSKSPFLPLPSSSSRSSLSFLFLILLSLRSLYSLIPFLRSSPSSFSVFPFSFLVSLFSFLLTLSFSLFPSPLGFSRHPSRVDARERWFLRLRDLSVSQNKALVSKSVLLAGVFLVRFQALRYCGAAAMILAELSGSVAARFMIEGRNRDSVDYNWSKVRNSRVRGFIALVLGLLMLSFGWDRISCFPVRGLVQEKGGVFRFLSEDCVRVWPMALPFISGFLGCYECISMDWNTVKELGKKRVRLISLLYTTLLLFVPAVISIMVFEHDGDSISIGNLGWPLVNTVVFGVLLSENFSDEKLTGSGDFRREFLVTFGCTVVLDLVYFPELSLWGLTLCGMLLYVAVVELDPVRGGYVQMGIEQSETFSFLVVNPLRHILSERKSRKIALFLLINAGYMVVEFVAGFMCNSLGLISDACHMLFDCAALAIGLYASYISRLPANSQFNYGRGRFEVLSGYVNAVFLVLVGALIVLESFERILDPQDISTNSLLAVSIGGLLVNMIGLIFFHEEHHHAHGGSCSHSHSPLDGHSHSHSQPHKNDHSVCHRPQEHKHDHHHIHHECGSITSGTLEQLCPDDTHDHRHHHEYSGVTDQERTCCDHVHVNDHHDHHGHNHHQLDDVDWHSHRSHSSSHISHEVKQPAGESRDQKHGHRHVDHNMEGIFLHVLADTMGSVGVVISTLLIKYKGWLVADPASSIFISIMIISSVFPLLRNSAEILLQRVPRAHEQEIFETLEEVVRMKGVTRVPNLHVWSFTNEEVVGTMHVHVDMEHNKASVKAKVSRLLHDAGVKDLTLEVECAQQERDALSIHPQAL